MGQPFLGEIRILSFNFAPKGWALCNGQLLPINQNQALFSLLGTTYGGDGRVNFALPDLRGRAPLHFGSGFTLGQRGGEQAHTVTLSELPQHNHFVQGSSATAQSPPNPPLGPGGNVFAVSSAQLYAPFNTPVALNPATVSNVGGSQAHVNMQPFLVLTFAIALQGIFPSQN